MSAIPLEKRVSDLERRMKQMQALLPKAARTKDWRLSVGVFTDDTGMQEIMTEAMRLRAADRALARRRSRKAPPRTVRHA